jgi:hypothetical protein
MLRLAHPAPSGQGADPPARRKHTPSPSLFLTSDESRYLRASIRNIARARYGSLVKLAQALDVDPQILSRKRHPHPGLAVALWRLTGTPLEELLSVKLAAVPSPSATPQEGGAS